MPASLGSDAHQKVSRITTSQQTAQSSLSALQRELASIATAYLIDRVHADNPLPQQTIDLALWELRRQMIGSGHYVNANTLGVTFTRTGLDGEFTFTIPFAPLDVNPGHTSAASIFTALEEQVGLRLEETRAPVETLVVDRLERPSPN